MKLQSQYFKGVLFLFWLSLLVNIITWLVIYFKIRPTSSEIIPLHYNIFYGTDFVGKGFLIYTIPVIGLIILAVNYFFYKYSLDKEKFGAKILLSVGLVAQLVILAVILFLKSKILI